MKAHNTRTARPGLESLEGRIVLSSTTLSATTAEVGQQSNTSTMQVQYQSATTQSITTQATTAATARFSYSFAVGPSSILLGTNTTTANGRSSGSVALALVRNQTGSAQVGGAAVSFRMGFVATTGSATPEHPDRFNYVPFTITLQLRDAWGRTAAVVFKGTINGTLSWKGSNLWATIQSPIRRVTLGNNVYTVTLPSGFKPGAPYQSPVTLYAKIQVTARV